MSDDQTYSVTAGELRAFVERIEQGEAEKSEAAKAVKGVYAEAKGRGYDAKALRKIVADRKRDKDDLAEEAAIVEMYKTAMGMN